MFRESEDKQKLRNVVSNVARYIRDDIADAGHNKYAYGYLIYLILNVLNVLFNIFLLDLFLNGEFLNLGIRFGCNATQL